MPDGTTSYTRDGSFQLSPTGEIVTADGYVVQPGITFPTNTTAIIVNANGQVQATDRRPRPPRRSSASFSSRTSPTRPASRLLGNNLLQQTPASGAPVTGNPGTTAFGTLQQGFLETSNVNIVTEITNMITAQRAYEMNSKVIQTSDQMMSTLSQIQ